MKFVGFVFDFVWFLVVLGGPGGPKAASRGLPRAPRGRAATLFFDEAGWGTTRGALPLLRINRALCSAELKGPRKLLRIRPEIFDFEPELGLKRGQTKPKIPGTVPTDRHTTIPNDSGPISACFDDDPKLLKL